MEKKFSTNIKCTGCIEKVTPFLNEVVGTDNWKVDLASPQRVLTVSGDVSPEEVKESLQKAGYKAETL